MDNIGRNGIKEDSGGKTYLVDRKGVKHIEIDNCLSERYKDIEIVLYTLSLCVCSILYRFVFSLLP